MIDCEACSDAPLLDGLRRKLAEGESSLMSAAATAAGIELTVSSKVGLTGVAADWGDAEACAGTTDSAATCATASGARELLGLGSRVAVAVATDSASVRTSARSGSTALLSAAAVTSG